MNKENGKLILWNDNGERVYRIYEFNNPFRREMFCFTDKGNFISLGAVSEIEFKELKWNIPNF